MVQCNFGGCPDSKDICCLLCPGKEGCPDSCLETPKECGYSTFEGEDTGKHMVIFKTEAGAIIRAVADLTLQKKQIEEQEKRMREQLRQAMERYGVKSFENEDVKFTYVAPTTRTSIDSAKLRKDLPDVAQKYSKTSPIAASVKITVKE